MVCEKVGSQIVQDATKAILHPNALTFCKDTRRRCRPIAETIEKSSNGRKPYISVERGSTFVNVALTRCQVAAAEHRKEMSCHATYLSSLCEIFKPRNHDVLYQSTTIQKLQRVQNNGALIVLQASRRSHAKLLLHQLHWLPVQQPSSGSHTSWQF